MITHVIFGAFLLGTLVLGLWAGKDVKTMKDYVLANRSLSTAIVTMSLLATFIAAGDVVQPYWAFSRGIITMIMAMGHCIAFFLIGAFIVPNLVHFQDCLTTADLMYKFYGKKARLFAGIIGFLFSLLCIGTQIRALAYLSSYLLGITPSQAILLFGTVIVFYTFIGGMRSVAFTDVVQLVAVMTTLVVLIVAIVYNIGGLKALFNQIPAEKLEFFNSKRFFASIKSTLFWGVIPTSLFAPPIVLRMLMVQDKRKVRKMFFTGGIVFFLIRCMLVSIGLGVVVLYSNFEPLGVGWTVNETGRFLPFVIKSIFVDSPSIHIVLFIGLMAVFMSTADSFLHTAGICLSHDIIKPLLGKKNLVVNEVKWTRMLTLLTGIMAIGLAIMASHKNILLAGYGVLILGTILIPLIVGIMGLKTHKLSFWLFCISFSVSIVVTRLMTPLYRAAYWQFFFSMGIATLLFFISHYIINKGFVTVQRTYHTTGHKLWLPSWRGFTNILTSYIPTPGKLAKVTQRKVSSYGSEPFLFSIFFICASPIVLLNIPQAPSNLYITALVFGIAITLCCGLMLEVKWRLSLKPYFPLYWFFTLLYCLPFAGTLLFLTNPESSTAMVSLGLAWFLLMLCVDWKSFFILALLGTGVASGAYGYVTGSFWPMMDFDAKWNFYLAVIAILTACFLFAQRRELYNKIRLQRANLYAGSIAHETKNYLGTSRFAGLRINEAIQKKQLKALERGDLYTIPKQFAEELMLLGPELEEGASQSLSKINMFMSALKENIISAKLAVSSMKACVGEALKDGYFKGEEVRKGLVLRLDDDFKAKVSEVFFKHVIYNLVKNAYWHGGATRVIITLDATKRSLCVEDNGHGIDSASLPYIFDLFYSGGSGSGIGLALVKVIVEGFGGSIHCDSKQGMGSYTKFVVCFPDEGI